MSWSTSKLKVRLVLWNQFKPSSKLFLLIVSMRYLFCGSFVFFYVLCLSCFRVCSLLPCGHLLGKGWPLGSCSWCLIVFLSLSHVLSWIKFGTWLYRLLIFVAFLTLIHIRTEDEVGTVNMLKPSSIFFQTILRQCFFFIIYVSILSLLWCWGKADLFALLCVVILVHLSHWLKASFCIQSLSGVCYPLGIRRKNF